MTTGKSVVPRATPAARGSSLSRGLAAGLVGGLAAMAARSYLKRRSAREPVTLELPAGAPPDGSLVARRAAREPHLLNWALGAAAGAAYGAAAEYYPAATSRDGAAFGLALGALSQDGPLTALGLRPPGESTREKTREMTLFVLFGVVTESVRRVVRRML